MTWRPLGDQKIVLQVLLSIVSATEKVQTRADIINPHLRVWASGALTHQAEVALLGVEVEEADHSLDSDTRCAGAEGRIVT